MASVSTRLQASAVRPPPAAAPPSTYSATSTTKSSSAQVQLHRRLLFPNLPASQPVPPLLLTASQELNAELYDFIAIALRAHITPWWSKITRYDREFLPHVASILVHVFRALEARVHSADLAHVLLRALPVVLVQHYTDYRAAAAKVGTSYAAGGAASLAQIFHQLQGHMAIDADGHIDASYVRHAVDHVLQVCLPPEDYASDAEHAIIREVIVKVLLDNVVPLLIQPWFVHKLVLDQLRAGAEKPLLSSSTPSVSGSKKALDSSGASGASGFSIHTVVVFVLSAVQYLSGMCLAVIQFYKQTAQTIVLVNGTGSKELASSAPQVPQGYGAHMFSLVSVTVRMEERSASRAILTLLEIVSNAFCAFIDRCLLYMLARAVLTESTVISGVRAAKQTLYPNGYPGPPPVVPTGEEQAEMKEEVIRRIAERIPGVLSGLVLGPDGRQTVAEVFKPLSSEACNAHLVLFLLDVVIVGLFPELAVPVSDDTSGASRSCSSRDESEPASGGG